MLINTGGYSYGYLMVGGSSTPCIIVNDKVNQLFFYSTDTP